MTAPLPDPTLSPQDLYVLARALVGLDWREHVRSPPVRLLLSIADMNTPDDPPPASWQLVERAEETLWSV